MDQPSSSSVSGNFSSGTSSAFRSVEWKWTDLLIGLTTIVVYRVLIWWLDAQQVRDIARWLLLPAAIFVMGLMGLFPLWCLRRRTGRLPTIPFRRAILEAGIALPIFILIWIGLITVLAIWTELIERPTLPNPIGPALRVSNPSIVLLVIFLAVLVSPLTEEVFFRGFLYSALSQRLHPLIAAVIQAVLFGALHTFNTTYAVVAALAGLALAAIYEWRRTLLAPIYLHSLQNTAAVVAALFLAQDVANKPVLGVRGEPYADGCIITSVHPGGGADNAGLRAGDVVTHVDGIPVSNLRDIAAVIQQKHVGDKVSLSFSRGEQGHEIEAVLSAASEIK